MQIRPASLIIWCVTFKERFLENYQAPPSDLTDPPTQPSAEQEPLASGCWRVLREIFETLLLAGLLFLVINGLTARVRVDGPSMEPSFFNQDRIVVSKVSYFLGEIERGDVIVFPAPRSPEEDYIKRVIGLPGDSIRIAGGYVYVNEVPIEEPYIMAPTLTTLSETIVPEGSVFVMGDNRNVSSDSRAWGSLPVEDVVGKAVFVYWPFSAMRVIEHFDFGVVE